MSLKAKISNELLKTNAVKPIDDEKSAKEHDHFTINKANVDTILLMENAGKSIYDEAVKYLSDKKITNPHICIFVGPGNNGGDALVAARHFACSKYSIDIILLGSVEKNPLLKKELQLLERVADLTSCHIKFCSIKHTYNHKPNLIIDGILGAGLNRSPQGDMAKAIRLINNLKKQLNLWVISIDIPSGLTLNAIAPLGLAVKADQTITFGHLKRAHITEPSKEYCGYCQEKEIGLVYQSPAKDFFVYEQRVLTELFRELSSKSHKKDFGHVLIFAGEEKFLGATKLSAISALRAGAGLVTVLNDKINSSYIPEVICSTSSDLDLSVFDVLLIGPGLGRSKTQQQKACDLLNSLHQHISNIIIDADALRLLNKSDLNLQNKNIIATPHPGEVGYLLGISAKEVEQDRFGALSSLASLTINKKNNVTWLLKGATTLVSNFDETFAFLGDLPILSVGGSGDVLSGAIAALIKQSHTPFSATLLAVSMQIATAKMMSKDTPKGILPSEIANNFPQIKRIFK